MDHAEVFLTGLQGALERIAPDDDVGVLFSGGLDSCIVAALLAQEKQVTLYTAGLEDSYDLRSGERAAEIMDLPWVPIVPDEEELLDGVRSIIRSTGSVNPILISFDIPLYFVSSRAKERMLFSGQGADELFAGLARCRDLDDERRQECMDTDMAKLLNETLAGEARIAEDFGKDLRYIFLDPGMVDTVKAMSLGLEAAPDINKVILREVARRLDLGELAERREKTDRYGPGSMRSLREIAKSRGITMRALMQQLAEEV